MAPQLVFGTASFGMDKTEFQDAESVKVLLRTLQELDINRLDTGARYPPLSPGRSEQLIGEAKELSGSFVVDTKVFTDTSNDGSGDLSREAMRKSVSGSLQRLQRQTGVNVLYAHRADPSTPLEEQIQAFNEQISQGHCKAWGVSNVPVNVLEKMLQLCEENGWQKPSCYQGDYNLVTRGMETKLLPLLRAHNISFTCFRALASGFLTGNAINNQSSGTRFANDNPLGKAMLRVYGDEGLNNAMRKFDTAVKEEGFMPTEVAIRWVYHHSALDDGDNILLGASKKAQLTETVGFIRKGPLSATLLTLADEIWDAVKETRGEII
ncbi:putative oxidoreductase [Whalleya microplaca]|nr:putative oxidoreductase [Whalleya microplaca]